MLLICIYIYVAVFAYILYNKYTNFSDNFDDLQKPISNSNSIASGIGVGHAITISFCTSCSYRGCAMATKQLLEEAFPGIEVILSKHPPALPKRLMIKLIPVLQIGVIGFLMGGEQIFRKFGYQAPPSWYHSLRANRYGTIVSTWIVGNYMRANLRNSGAFEVFCNGELVFSKLKKQRFPGGFELRELVSRKLEGYTSFEGLAVAGDFW